MPLFVKIYHNECLECALNDAIPGDGSIALRQSDHHLKEFLLSNWQLIPHRIERQIAHRLHVAH